MNEALPARRAPRVLLVDDDRELLEMLRDYLEQDGFAVACAHDGVTGAMMALSGSHDVAVLDVMMPGSNGFNALKEIRSASTLPIIMLTARGDDSARIAGLESGADDYVSKPCTARELAARLRSILKRVEQHTVPLNNRSSLLKVGSLTIWPTLRRAEDDGRALDLTSTEFNLLEMLARHAGQSVSKATLSIEVLGRPLTRFDRSIDVHIHSVRSKLGSAPDGRSRIQTVIRKGYLLIADWVSQ